jgi:hypothetical protein
MTWVGGGKNGFDNSRSPTGMTTRTASATANGNSKRNCNGNTECKGNDKGVVAG